MRLGPAQFAERFEEMKAAVEQSSPWARSGHAWYRGTFHDVPANRLITGMSGVEGMARSLVAQTLAGKTKDRILAYRQVRRWSVTQLLIQVASDESKTPHLLFGEEVWEDFAWAIKFRNLLVHEGAILSDMAVADRLLRATVAALRTLRHVGQGRGITQYGRPRLRR